MNEVLDAGILIKECVHPLLSFVY